MLSDDLRMGRLVEILVLDLPSLARESVLVRLKRDEPLPGAANAFLHALREEARERHLLGKPVS
jgi:DNA-binding transcriptional LysR family regulator